MAELTKGQQIAADVKAKLEAIRSTAETTTIKP
jgi:hypothetical protein